MGKYLSAELYKATHRKYIFIFLGCILALVALFMGLLRVESLREVDGMITSRLSVGELLGILSTLLTMGLYFLMIAADIVFSEQYKYNTLKNEVSFGLPRTQVYLGKFLASLLVAMFLCAALISGYLVFACVLFPIRNEMMGESLRAFGLCFLMAFPLWLGGLGFFHMLQFLMKGSTAATIVYVMVVSVSSGFLNLLSGLLPSLASVARVMRTISLQTPFDLLNEKGPEELMGYAWALGLAWLAGSTVIGLIGFKKKEIN